MKTVFIDGKAGTTGLRIYERLASRDDIKLITLSDELRKDNSARKNALNSCDIAFLCLPDAASIEAVSLIENENVVVLDTSTAHRTSPDWAYGFPELNEQFYNKIKNSKRIAVPGCHASGFISLVKPLIDKGVLPKSAQLSCHSITGFSGGGKNMIADYGENKDNLLYQAPRQYGINETHKHLKEMQAICGLDTAPCFAPIVCDFYSGMQVTVQLFKEQLKAGTTLEDIKNIYKSAYSTDIVSSFDEADNGFLSASKLSGSDAMQVGAFGNDDRIMLVSRYDNLGKGASGAAIECMNIVIGCDNKKGLEL